MGVHDEDNQASEFSPGRRLLDASSIQSTAASWKNRTITASCRIQMVFQDPTVLRWLDSITDSMDMNLGKLREIGKDRESWRAAAHGLQTVGHNLAPEQQWQQFF